VRTKSWLNRTVVMLTLVSLTQDAASELLYPLLPVLLTTILGAPAVVVGIIEGCAEAAAGLAKLVSGRLSDRIGRKPVTGVGYGLAALGKVIVAAAGGWQVVLVGRVVDRLGKGTRAASRDAWLASSVPPEALGRAFGFHRMGDTVGAVIGPLLGLLILSGSQNNIRHALWIAVIPALLSGLLVILAPEKRSSVLPQPQRTGVPIGDSAKSGSLEALSGESALVQNGSEAPELAAPELATPGSVTHHLATPGSMSAGSSVTPVLGTRFATIAGTLTAIAIVNFPDALLLLRLHDLSWSTSSILLAYVAYNLVYTAASYPAGALSDRFSPVIVYAIGLTFFGFAYLGLGTLAGGPHSVGTWLLLALYGLFPACTDGVGKAWISSVVPDEIRGKAQGIFQSLGNGAVFLAGLWAGLLWTHGGGKGALPLVISGVAGIGGAIVMLCFAITKRGLR
jgi:MFS family permease